MKHCDQSAQVCCLECTFGDLIYIFKHVADTFIQNDLH